MASIKENLEEYDEMINVSFLNDQEHYDSLKEIAEKMKESKRNGKLTDDYIVTNLCVYMDKYINENILRNNILKAIDEEYGRNGLDRVLTRLMENLFKTME